MLAVTVLAGSDCRCELTNGILSSSDSVPSLSSASSLSLGFGVSSSELGFALAERNDVCNCEVVLAVVCARRLDARRTALVALLVVLTVGELEQSIGTKELVGVSAVDGVAFRIRLREPCPGLVIKPGEEAGGRRRRDLETLEMDGLTVAEFLSLCNTRWCQESMSLVEQLRTYL